MPFCSAIDCKKRTGSKSDFSENNVSFHRLPTHNRSQWIHRIRRENIKALKEVRICSDHFEASCFKRDLKSELMGTKPKAELTEDAVPTIFSHAKRVDKRKSSSKRIGEVEKRQLFDDLVSANNSTTEINDTIHQDVKFELCEIAIQTELTFPPSSDVAFFLTNQMETDDIHDVEKTDVESSELSQDELDDSYIPSSQESQDSTDCRDDVQEKNVIDDVKLVVVWSCLLQLLSFCRVCKSKAIIKTVNYFGFAVSVNLLCDLGHKTTWSSMPKINELFSMNLLLPAAILFSGSRYEVFKDICDAIGIRYLGKTRFNYVQKAYLFPAIHNVYKKVRAVLIDEIKRNKSNVDLSGDARCDSPGYSAKYSTYSLMDTTTSRILHFHVTHVNHVGNSSRMEKSGLISVLNKIESMSINVNSLVTDRHPGVTKYLREEKQNILHQFDIWHFSKNIKKALSKAGKKKDCEIINDWTKAIINHFWWCCKTCDGSEEILRERWTSLMFHISNRHRWVGYKHFKQCIHQRLSKKDIKNKLWIKEGTPAYVEVEKIVKKRKTLTDLKHCTKFMHSGNLEVFHSVLLKFCPKRIHFSLNGMIARTELAILHFNSVVSTDYAETKAGKQVFKHEYSKITNSWVIKRVRAKPEKCYIRQLLDEVMRLIISNEKSLPITSVQSNIARIEKPKKEDSIRSMKSRFK